MANPPLTLSNISFDDFCKIRDCLRKNNVEISKTEEGTINSHGICGLYKWDRNTQTLRFEINDKPSFLSIDFIYNTINHAVKNVIENE